MVSIAAEPLFEADEPVPFHCVFCHFFLWGGTFCRHHVPSSEIMDRVSLLCAAPERSTQISERFFYLMSAFVVPVPHSVSFCENPETECNGRIELNSSAKNLSVMW